MHVSRAVTVGSLNRGGKGKVLYFWFSECMHAPVLLVRNSEEK